MEFFTALEFEEDALDALERAGQAMSLLERFAGVRSENRADLHLTLRYLGCGFPPDRIIERLNRVAHPAFRLALNGLGMFCNQDKTALWAGVEGDLDKLDSLKTAVDQALAELPLAQEAQPFFPHITLATMPNSGTGEMCPVHGCTIERVAIEVRAFCLYGIRPRGGQPQFQKLRTFHLIGGSRYG